VTTSPLTLHAELRCSLLEERENNEKKMWNRNIKRVCTFFAVMLVVVKRKSVVTGALVAAHRVLADVLASAIVRRTLILIYRRHTTSQCQLVGKQSLIGKSNSTKAASNLHLSP